MLHREPVFYGALWGVVQEAGTENFLAMAAEIALHHERWDGTGYPLGLQGDAIPLSARIAAVADVFDALTSNRVYKVAMSVKAARSTIIEGSGTQFDPVVVDAFLDCFDQCVAIREQIYVQDAARTLT